MALNIFNVLFQGFNKPSRSKILLELLRKIIEKKKKIIILTANTIGIDGSTEKELIIKLFEKCGIPITMIHCGCSGDNCGNKYCKNKVHVIMKGS